MIRSPIHDQTEFKDRRKRLRKTLTKAEATLWALLKGNGIEGRKFRRQHSVGKYVLDFYCYSEKLAIELDGAHHFTDEGMTYDERRTDCLNTFGIIVLSSRTTKFSKARKMFSLKSSDILTGMSRNPFQ